MNRREVIQRATMILGYAITGPAVTGILNGCKATPEEAFAPQLFSQDQIKLIAELSEIIIPRPETPGAKDVAVPMFIDRMLKEVYPKEDQEAFLKNLAAFDEGARKEYGNNFLDCDDDEKQAYFKKEHDDAVKKSVSAASSGWWNAGIKQSKPFMVELKELTLLGFFTSEPGATQVLQYKQVPGPFKGCVPLKEVGKTWAT
ncbi:MAG TPA: gluconate 2-dehydrogenase subunit 3 family protein [Sphingobacteriaceae bacterium]